jgi:GDP-L-fucose synthase
MLGTHVAASLQMQGHTVLRHGRDEADLTKFFSVLDYFKSSKPDVIVHCAALVGGIKANIESGPLYYNYNVLIDSNVFRAAIESQIENLIYIGSSCMYPANREAALRPVDIFTGPLEPTNFYYALAKIFGTNFVSTISEQLGYSWRTFVASNLYGPMDHFETDKSHLISAIISKAVKAKKDQLAEIEMWGDGSPRREFTYTPEFAYWISSKVGELDKMPPILNVGYGIDFPVIEYYRMVLEELNLDISIRANTSRPSGNKRKLLDSSIARSLGWAPEVDIRSGIRSTIEWYLSRESKDK